MRCLAKHRDDRPATAHDLSLALRLRDARDGRRLKRRVGGP